MAGCCGPKCSKAFVIFFNILFWFSGCALVALGVCLLYDQTYGFFFTMLTADAFPPSILQYTAFGCIALGGFILFVGFFGCCGALQDSKCMLGTYVFCLILVFLVEAGVALICLYCRFYFPPEVRTMLKNKLNDEYSLPGNEQFTTAMDFTQYELNCCGVEGMGDYEHSKWINKSTAEMKKLRVPLTCCVQDKKEWQEEDAWQKPTPRDEMRCQARDPIDYTDNVNQHGCYRKLEQWYLLHNLILTPTLGGLALLQIIGVVFSICLMRNIGEEA